jgi:tetratricopeptide (TPR) repeat protein
VEVATVLADMSERTDPRQAGLTLQIAFRRAVALQSQGNLAEAEKIYLGLLKQNPGHFGTLYNLAAAMISMEQPAKAELLLQKAVRREPNSAAAHTLLARALQLLDRYDEALKRARRAIALDTGYAEAYAILAQGLAELGRYDEARLALARAIELAPDRPGPYYQWGFLTRWTADDPRLAGLNALAQKLPSLPVDQQVQVHFSLAKAHADFGDVERAIRHQIDGGALQRRMLVYDEAASLGEMVETCRTLDAEWVLRHSDVGDPSPLPVFILGMPRSGTTLVEQILASHPEVHTLGERVLFDGALAQICGMPAVPRSLAQMAARWSDADLRRLGALYLETARRDAPETAMRITDKLPENFQYIGLIHAALPNARIIHTRRDPVDTCLSLFSILFSGSGAPYSYDLAELGRYYRAYEKVMEHWRNVLPVGAMLEVQYEDIVDDLERQARRIVAYCGLEWNDACLAFHEADRPVRTSSHAQVRQPIYRSSVGRPRPPRDLLAPLLAALGVD